MLIGFALPILAAVGIVVLHEAHTSRLQARELARYAATLDYEVRQGPSEAILFPADGPSTAASATSCCLRSCSACTTATTPSPARRTSPRH